MRVCLLVANESSGWFHRSIERLIKKQEDVSVELIVRKQETEKSNQEPSRSPIYQQTYHHLKQQLFIFSGEKFQITSNQFDNNPEVIEVVPEEVGDYRVSLPDNVLKKIDSDCDIIIQNHFGILTGDVLDTTKDGVLSVHWGNIRKYRGSHPGLWQILNDENEMILTVQRLTETLDGGQVVYEHPIDISDLTTPREVKRAAYQESKYLYPEAIQRVRDSDMSPSIVPDDELGRNYRTSMVDTKVKLLLLWRIAMRLIRNKIYYKK